MTHSRHIIALRRIPRDIIYHITKRNFDCVMLVLLSQDYRFSGSLEVITAPGNIQQATEGQQIMPRWQLHQVPTCMAPSHCRQCGRDINPPFARCGPGGRVRA